MRAVLGTEAQLEGLSRDGTVTRTELAKREGVGAPQLSETLQQCRALKYLVLFMDKATWNSLIQPHKGGELRLQNIETVWPQCRAGARIRRESMH